MDFTNSLSPGLEARKSETVSERNTALALGSGSLGVYATPAMIALMEAAALSAVGEFLPAGFSTVGTEINIKHISATPVGMKVYARAELISMEGKALSFKVEAFDEAGIIGEGIHRRFIIENERFMNKTAGKNKPA